MSRRDDLVVGILSRDFEIRIGADLKLVVDCRMFDQAAL